MVDAIPGPTMSVVIVNWNEAEFTRRCLRSLEAQTDRAFETVVVDNGSKDDSAAMVRREFPWVKLIETGANLGFAGGSNAGLEVATGDWIATLNNDTIVDPRWAEELRKAARTAAPEVGMLQSCMVLLREDRHINSTGLQLYSDGRADDRDFGVAPREAAGAGEIFCPTAGAALYRRAMLEATRLSSGYFDSDYFMYFEDVDLGWRCRLAGWSALYVPEAIVLHEFQGSSKKLAGSFIGLHLRRNRLRTLLKNGSWGFFVKALPRTVSDLATAVMAAGPKVLPSFVTAARDGLRRRSTIEEMRRVQRDAVEKRWVVRKGIFA
ncbi:MAG: glycosyltransferase family 2 protein [Polyangiales bacterium]